MFGQPDRVIAGLVHHLHALKGSVVDGCQGHAPARPTEKLKYAKFQNAISYL